VALQPVVGLDFDEVGKRVLLLLYKRECKRDAQQPAGDFTDLHGLLPSGGFAGL
jgi:hypothetical protein